MFDGWINTTIGEIIKKNGGNIKTGPFGTVLKAKEYSRYGVPIISVGEIDYGVFKIRDSTPRAPIEVTQRLPEFLLEEGDIVFGRKGAVDRNAMVKSEQVGWFLGSDGIRLRLHSNVNSQFIAYQLQDPITKFWLFQHATGTTMASLNQDIIERIPIILPTFPEQLKIGKILRTLDDKITLNDNVNETLRGTVDTVFKSWFIDFKGQTEWDNSELGKIPKGWKYGFLGDGILTNILKPSVSKFDGEKIYLDTSSVQNFSITKTNYKITYDIRPTRANMQPKINSIWFAKMKDSKKIIFFDNYTEFGIINFILSTGFAGIETKDYSLYYILSFISNSKFEEMKDGLCNGTTMQAINNEHIMKIDMLIPKKEILLKFNNFAKQIYEKIYQNDLQSITLNEIRNSYLSKFMSGEIRV